jgi:hypothetical protein
LDQQEQDDFFDEALGSIKLGSSAPKKCYAAEE